jgi:23S rRNA U2552 (ribose-2'-O)-methylase RlmE/FtsJ
MIYFLLPKTYLLTYKNINFSSSETAPVSYISNSLSYYLYNIKEKINTCEKEWDLYKKYTNPYEYIHTIIPNKRKCIAKYKPLSRSYFKMVELLTYFKLSNFGYNINIPLEINIHNNNNNTNNSNNNMFLIQPNNTLNYNSENNFTDNILKSSMEIKYILQSKLAPITTFHLAEGPGGFIEAICETRNNPEDIYIGMTILDHNNDYDIPSWKKSKNFLKNNPNVFIEEGIDKTGDILKLENFVYCKNKYGSSIDFITADGGFDFSSDFNRQEISVTKLLFAQIAFALCMQKKNGHFILKIFDVFMEHTVDLLYLLSSFYEKVYITKPQTSRYANSEKYVVCKNFIFNTNVDFYPYLYNAFNTMTQNNEYVHRFLNINISNHFITKLEEYNSIFGQQQTENIYYTISLIETKNKTEKLDTLIKTNIQKCINWCVRHNIQYNNTVNNINVFLPEIKCYNSSNEQAEEYIY